MNAGVLFLALLLPQEQQQPDPAAARKVNVTKAWYLKGPKWSADPIEKAEEGDEVTVLGTEGKYSKVRLKKKDLTAWIDSTALVTPDKFVRSESDEKVGTKASAQAMEAQRGIDENMEKEYRSKGGAAREQSFKDLDAWMARPSYYPDRARLVARLKEFQKEGKLGEYSPVK
jgi:uncharacterized protein YgiM (DUF1202 family)